MFRLEKGTLTFSNPRLFSAPVCVCLRRRWRDCRRGVMEGQINLTHFSKHVTYTECVESHLFREVSRRPNMANGSIFTSSCKYASKALSHMKLRTSGTDPKIPHVVFSTLSRHLSHISTLGLSPLGCSSNKPERQRWSPPAPGSHWDWWRQRWPQKGNV